MPDIESGFARRVIFLQPFRVRSVLRGMSLHNFPAWYDFSDPITIFHAFSVTGDRILGRFCKFRNRHSLQRRCQCDRSAVFVGKNDTRKMGSRKKV